MYCFNCGREIAPGFNFCGYCGTAVASDPSAAPAVVPPVANGRPLKSIQVKGEAPTGKSVRKRPSGKLKVLVIDDDQMFLEGYLFKFEKEGFDVVLARNGEEGLKFARSESPSAILLDILMPGMNGLEVLRRLKEDPETKDIPVVLVTIVDEKTVRDQGLALGAEYYVTKEDTTSDNVVNKIRAAALGSEGAEK